MNELDDTLARLFAEPEPDSDSEAFAAAVRRRVAWRRRLANVTDLGLVAAVAAGAAVLVAFVPEAPLYPARMLLSVASSPLGIGACMLGAGGLAWWSRFGDA